MIVYENEEFKIKSINLGNIVLQIQLIDKNTLYECFSYYVNICASFDIAEFELYNLIYKYAIKNNLSLCLDVSKTQRYFKTANNRITYKVKDYSLSYSLLGNYSLSEFVKSLSELNNLELTFINRFNIHNNNHMYLIRDGMYENVMNQVKYIKSLYE